jgi:hypothetical protein
MYTETKQTGRQIVGEIYTRVWDLFWLPVRFGAGQLLALERFPQWTPWIIGARLGRWPQKIDVGHYKICHDATCETCRSLKTGEIDIDEVNEIKHGPFRLID